MTGYNEGVNPRSIFGDMPVCRAYFEMIRNGEYAFLFDEYAAQIAKRPEEFDTPFGKSCLFTIIVRGMLITFNSNPHDADPKHPSQVAPLDAETNDWYPPNIPIQFLENRWSTYQYREPGTRSREENTSEKRRQELIRLIEFFSTDEYWRRKNELIAWNQEDGRRYMQQLYDAREARLRNQDMSQ